MVIVQLPTLEIVERLLSCFQAFYDVKPEPGICRRNEDSHGTETENPGENCFQRKKNRQAYFFLKMNTKMMDL